MAILQPLLSTVEKRGRPPKWPQRHVADAVFYLLSGKGTVRMDERSEGPTFEMVEAWIEGWDCTDVFDDEVVGGLDWEKLDQLRDNLAASESIIEVLHEDREVYHLKAGIDLPSVEGKVTESVGQTGVAYGDCPP